MGSFHKKDLLSTNRLLTVFKMFDTDNSGSVSTGELHELLGLHADSNVLKEMIGEADLGSGYPREEKDLSNFENSECR